MCLPRWFQPIFRNLLFSLVFRAITLLCHKDYLLFFLKSFTYCHLTWWAQEKVSSVALAVIWIALMPSLKPLQFTTGWKKGFRKKSKWTERLKVIRLKSCKTVSTVHIFHIHRKGSDRGFGVYCYMLVKIWVNTVSSFELEACAFTYKRYG